MSTEERPPTLSVEEASQRLEATKAALRAAEDAHAQALQVYADAEGQHAEGRDLARLALEGNAVAMRRLDEQVRALHPGIVGYLPVPTSNDGPGFRRSLEDLGLRIDFPAETDPEFVSGLAAALREFVRRYEPKINSPKAKSGRQGCAYAETRAGTLQYATNDRRPAHLVHLRDVFSDDPARPDEHYQTLEEALAALPTLVFLAALSGRRHANFPMP